MRPESLKLFAKLMENGYITREQSPAYYEYYNDPEIASELAIMEQELDFHSLQNERQTLSFARSKQRIIFAG